MEVLNKAAVVLITSFFEAYCEDLAAEALERLGKHSNSAEHLPKELQKRVAKSLKSDIHDLAIWKLADDGWRDVLKSRLAELQEERNRRLNTPKTAYIDELFEDAVGIPKVSAQWRWNKMSAKRAKEKLDEFVSLRGEVAHRGRALENVSKAQVRAYYRHVKTWWKSLKTTWIA